MEELKQRLNDALAESLGEAYDCIRVWSAWGYGTMGPDDFVLVAEDDNRMAEIVEAVCTAVGPDITALRAHVSALTAERDDLRKRTEDLISALVESERKAKHWKDQHANEVKRAKILKDTTDLPLERVRAYELMGELQGQVERLTADKARMEEDLDISREKSQHFADALVNEMAERDQLRAEVERMKKDNETLTRGYSLAQGTYALSVGDITALTIEVEQLRAELSTSYEKGAESMRERILPLLNGIDKEESETGEGWWETSTGAEFGKKVLADIRALPLKENEG